MRADAAFEHRVAVVQQVMRGQRRGDIVRRACNELRGIPGGDVLEHHAQPGQVVQQRLQHALDEHRLAVEHVHCRVGDLAVHQQRHAAALHLFQRGVGLAQVGDARIGVGGRSRRIQFHCVDVTAGPGFADFFGAGVVGQVQRHQRFELRAGGQRSEDARAVRLRLFGGGDRRPEVGHHDRARELPRGVRQHRLHQRAVAQMQVPVVGSGQGDLLHVMFRHGLWKRL